MRHLLFVMIVGVTAACSDKPPVSPPPTSDAGVQAPSGVEQPGTLERPPGDRLPEDLKPPAR
ncbi:hypothetical protein [Corallococcus sicarius]|uniref:hypothetical protein n=1 Tax=Corallococcus sicarius TaxID=2316726 RepID=UPI0011C3690B|nr:hypothetical protein [Corallococcus sicarius]